MNEEQLRAFLTSPFGRALEKKQLCTLAEIDKTLLSRKRKLNSQHLEALNKTLLKLANEIIVAIGETVEIIDIIKPIYNFKAH